MPGNLRKKTTGKSGVTERDYLRARRQVINSSQICHHCGEAIDLKLKPICRFVQVPQGVKAGDHVPVYCGDGVAKCSHKRKAHPLSASADHIQAVADLPSDSPLLTDPRNMRPAHLICNQRRQKGSGGRAEASRYRTSKDWFV